MTDQTTANRAPNLPAQLAAFNAHRRLVLGGRPPDMEQDRMPLPRSGVGGDVEGPDE